MKNGRRNKTDFKPKGLKQGKTLISCVWSASPNKDDGVLCVGYKGEKDWNNPYKRNVAARPDLLLKRNKNVYAKPQVPKKIGPICGFCVKSASASEQRKSCLFRPLKGLLLKCGGKSKKQKRFLSLHTTPTSVCAHEKIQRFVFLRNAAYTNAILFLCNLGISFFLKH